jgi:hypothetical protein
MTGSETEVPSWRRVPVPTAAIQHVSILDIRFVVASNPNNNKTLFSNRFVFFYLLPSPSVEEGLKRVRDLERRKHLDKPIILSSKLGICFTPVYTAVGVKSRRIVSTVTNCLCLSILTPCERMYKQMASLSQKSFILYRSHFLRTNIGHVRLRNFIFSP